MQADRRGFLKGIMSAGVGAGLVAATPVGLAARSRLPFPELKVNGSPGKMGMTHGRTFKQKIANNLRFYLKWLSGATGARPARLLEVARSFEPVMARHTPDLLEEIQGISRGSGRKKEEILLINARTDMLVMAHSRAKPTRRGVHPGCTALALTGPGERLALGQNWDWRPDLARGVVVLRLRPSRGPRIVTFTEAGMVGKIGFNQHHLGVCLNFLSHAADLQARKGAFGIPVHVLLRAVMGCATLEEAYKLVAWSPRCASANFLMAQHRNGRGAAMDLEWTADAVGRMPLTAGGPLVHTNHFISASLEAGCPAGKSRSTTNRYKVATALAGKLSRIQDPAERMRKILSSRKGAPYSISKTGAPDSPSHTLAGIVMDLARNRLYLTSGPPHLNHWVTRPGVEPT